MKKRTGFIFITLLFVLVMVGVRSNSDGIANLSSETSSAVIPDYVFTYAENQPKDYPTTKGAVRFSELVYERSQGRIKINVFYGGELGDEVSVMEQLQFGGIDFARVSAMSMGNEIPMLYVLQLPYIYRDSDHMWKVLDGEIGKEFMDVLPQYNLVGLSWYDAGARHFYNSVKPIERIEDLRRMKFRVAESDIMVGIVEALGAKPVSIGYSQVYAALETGRIDGAENNWPSYDSMGHFEVAKYITVDAHNRIPELQMVSKTTWNKLSESDQILIKECAQESSIYERGLWVDAEKESERKLTENGCIVTVLSSKEQLRFRSSMMTVYQKYCSNYIDVVNRISQLQ